MLNWNKGKESDNISEVDYIQDMEKKMDDICKMLSMASQEFVAKDFFQKIYGCITQKDRLLYTYITNYIFNLSDEEFGVLQTNIDQVVHYMYGGQCQKDYADSLKEDVERTQRTVLKIWDHVNLARRQYVMFQHKDEDYTKIVDEKMELAEAKISKEINIQLISLVAIFTALSFLVFGGISSLDNIFSGVKDIPVNKLVIIGTIWCFCIMNLVFVFLFFVAKITKLDMKSTDDVNANLVQKYPLIWWSNLFLAAILILSCWFYYVETENISRDIHKAVMGHSEIFFMAGTLAIIAVICLLAVLLVFLSRQGKTDQNRKKQPK